MGSLQGNPWSRYHIASSRPFRRCSFTTANRIVYLALPFEFFAMFGTPIFQIDILDLIQIIIILVIIIEDRVRQLFH